jgi:hypothetical protein
MPYAYLGYKQVLLNLSIGEAFTVLVLMFSALGKVNALVQVVKGALLWLKC